MKDITVRIAGSIRIAAPIEASDGFAEIPRHIIERHEFVYRMAVSFDRFLAEDLLIIEPGRPPATGECVLGTVDGKAFIGTWWKKHRKRELVFDPAMKPLRGVEIVGVINFVVRR